MVQSAHMKSVCSPSPNPTVSMDSYGKRQRTRSESDRRANNEDVIWNILVVNADSYTPIQS
jgi:hypothetical protein